MAPRRKTVRSNAEQLSTLVEYMSINPLFAAGEFTGPLGGQKNEKEWTKLKELLATQGPDKTVQQWKHTWRDLRRKARQEASNARAAASKTGNSVLIPQICEISQKILEIIGTEGALGIQTDTAETGIGDDDDGNLFSNQACLQSNFKSKGTSKYLAAMERNNNILQELAREKRVANRLAQRRQRQLNSIIKF